MDNDKIDQVLKLVQENNRILRGMHRRMLWSQVMTFVYWLIILGAAGWSYYTFQPYFLKYLSTYQKVMKQFDALQQTSSTIPTGLQNLLEKTK